MTEPIFARSPVALSRTVGGEILLAAPNRESVDRLSPTAGAVWSLLERPRTMSSLVEELVRTFDAPRARIEADLDILMSDLTSRGWITEVRSDG
jgi:hypothetical protein